MKLCATIRQYEEVIGDDNIMVRATLDDTDVGRKVFITCNTGLSMVELRKVPAALNRLIEMIEKTPY